MKEEIDRIMTRFKMKPHPEGGFFSAGSRSSEFLRADALPERYNSPRNLYSSIYFMVTSDSPSKFHRLRTDELWHFYKGDDLDIHTISDKGDYKKTTLTGDTDREEFQYLIRRNTWIAATCNGDAGYAFVGCTLSPGFEFRDFELADPKKLIDLSPRNEILIGKLT